MITYLMTYSQESQQKLQIDDQKIFFENRVRKKLFQFTCAWIPYGMKCSFTRLAYVAKFKRLGNVNMMLYPEKKTFQLFRMIVP